MRPNYLEYILLVILAVDSVAGGLMLNPYLLAASASLCAFAVLLHYFRDPFESMVFRHSNLVQVIDGYEIGGERNVATRRVGQKYVASAGGFISVESGTLDREKVESIISHFSYPFRLSMVVERLDSNRILDALRTKRSIKEIELSRVGNVSTGRGAAKASWIRRAIEQIEHDIKSVAGGYAPLKLAYYVLTSSESERRYSAEEEARSRARALLGAFDGALGSASSLASGGALIRMLRIDSMVTSGEIDGI